MVAVSCYRPAFEHGAFVRSAAGPKDAPLPRAPLVRRVTDLATLRDWYAVADEVFERPAVHPPHELATFLGQCTGSGARVSRFVAYEEGQPISSGGMTSFPALGFGYLWAGATLERARGRGYYRAVLDARLRHAVTIGLAKVGLYARVESSAPIVARLGFCRHGTMWYWERPAA